MLYPDQDGLDLPVKPKQAPTTGSSQQPFIQNLEEFRDKCSPRLFQHFEKNRNLKFLPIF
jgi:hypothetical protein